MVKRNMSGVVGTVAMNIHMLLPQAGPPSLHIEPPVVIEHHQALIRGKNKYADVAMQADR